MKIQSTLLAGICAFLTAGSANAETISWQGGSGTFTDANWTVDGTPDQNHGPFGSTDGSSSADTSTKQDDSIIKNTTIDGGTVTGFNFAAVGRIGVSDSLLITGGAAVFGDILHPAALHANDITLESGSMTFSDANSFRSNWVPFEGLINFTGAAGTVSVAQTDNSGTPGQELAGKASSGGGTNSYFRLDGNLVTTNGVSYDGTNLAAINTELAKPGNTYGGRYFQIEEAGGTQTLYLEAAAPEAADPRITSLAVFGDTATITMTGDDSVGYWCASSTDLTGFTTEETALQTGTATPIATNPDGSFNTSGGTLTFDVDVTGDSKLFLRIQDADPSP